MKEIQKIIGVEAATDINNNLFYQWFENQAAPLLLVDQSNSGAIIYANQAALSYYGYNIEIVKTLKINEIDVLTEAHRIIETERAKKEKRAFIYSRHRLASGEIRDVELTGTPLSQEDRKLMAYSVKDVTREQRSRKAFQMVAGISSRFVSSREEQLSINIDEAIKQVADFITADRGFVYLTGEKQDFLEISNCWFAPGRETAGIKSVEQGKAGINLEEFNWFKERLHTLNVVYVPEVDYLPGNAQAERELFKSDEIHSQILVPLTAFGKLLGILRFDRVSSSGAWGKEDIGFLKTVGEIFVNILEKLKSENAVKLSEKRYRTLFENAPGGIAVLGFDGRIIDLNSTVERIMGYKRTDMLGKKFAQFVSANDRQLFQKSQLDIARRGNSEGEIQIVTGQGHRIIMGGRAQVVYRGPEKVREIILFCRDITEQRRAEDEKLGVLSEMHAIMDHAQVGIALVRNRRIARANNRIMELFGYREGELLGKSTRLLYEDLGDFEDFGYDAYHALAEGGTYYKEMKMRRKDGSIFWCKLYGRGVELEKDTSAAIWIVDDMTEQKMAFMALQDSEERYRRLIEFMPDAIVVHRAGKIVFSNMAAMGLLGAGNMHELVNRSILDIFDPKHNKLARFNSVEASDSAPGASGSPSTELIEEKLLRMDGSVIDVEITGAPVVFEGSSATMVVIRDISERKQLEHKLLTAHAVYENTSEAIMVTNLDGEIQAVNPAFVEITGYDEGDVLGKKSGFMSSQRTNNRFYEKMWGSLLERGRWEGEVWNVRKDGSSYPAWLAMTSIVDQNGNVNRYTGVFNDISRRKKMEEFVKHQAYHDPLTGLANRALLDIRMTNAVSNARRRNRLFAVCFLDLDNFKDLNDVYGHEQGDELLKTVAEILNDSVRQGDTVVRYGGDEFVILLETIRSPEEAVVVVERMVSKFAERVLPTEDGNRVTPSIGVSIFPEHGDNPQELIRKADKAMYHAKQVKGKNTFHVLSAEDVAAIEARAAGE